MFLQILEWLLKFVSLLNDRDKLAPQANRKRIGKRLERLHSLIGDIAKNARAIRAHLEELRNDLKTFDGSLDPRGYLAGSPPRSMLSLQLALGEQRTLLDKLQNQLRDSKELLDVYGAYCGQEIAEITHAKISLIALITNLCLYDAPCILRHFSGWPTPWIPKSFDLDDIEVYRNEKNRRLAGDTERSGMRSTEYGWEDIYELAWKEEREPRDYFATNLGEDRKEAEALIDHLLEQIDSMDAARKLEQADCTLADVIKQYFRIEELFSPCVCIAVRRGGLANVPNSGCTGRRNAAGEPSVSVLEEFLSNTTCCKLIFRRTTSEP